MNTQRFLYVPYQLVRLPLTTVDMKVMSRMPVDAAPRRAFDLLLGTADVLAGRVLHSPDLQRAGAARLSQPARMSQPAPTSQPAATRPRPGPSAPEPDTAPEPATAEPDTAAVSVTTDEVEAEVEQLEEAAREQVVEDAAAKEHDTARSNQNVSTIRQGLRQEEVAAEVRAKRAEKRAAERARAGSD